MEETGASAVAAGVLSRQVLISFLSELPEATAASEEEVAAARPSYCLEAPARAVHLREMEAIVTGLRPTVTEAVAALWAELSSLPAERWSFKTAPFPVIPFCAETPVAATATPLPTALTLVARFSV